MGTHFGPQPQMADVLSDRDLAQRGNFCLADLPCDGTWLEHRDRRGHSSLARFQPSAALGHHDQYGCAVC